MKKKSIGLCQSIVMQESLGSIIIIKKNSYRVMSGDCYAGEFRFDTNHDKNIYRVISGDCYAGEFRF